MGTGEVTRYIGKYGTLRRVAQGHECFNQHRRLTEILFGLAAGFMPKLRNDEPVDLVKFRTIPVPAP